LNIELASSECDRIPTLTKDSFPMTIPASPIAASTLYGTPGTFGTPDAVTFASSHVNAVHEISGDYFFVTLSRLFKVPGSSQKIDNGRHGTLY
jgi:hypothetical protein